jgi:hypothetical protein
MLHFGNTVSFRQCTEGCAFRFRFEAKRKRIYFRFEAGFVSLWIETVDFTCETKSKWSEKSETKQKCEAKERNEKNKMGSPLVFQSLDSGWNWKRIERKELFWSKMKEKQPLFIFAMKWNEEYGSKSKRKEKYRSKTKQKEKFVKWKVAKTFMQFFCLEAKQKNWKRFKQKEAKKCMWNFRLNMRNGSETNPISLCFSLKWKEIWSGTGAP